MTAENCSSQKDVHVEMLKQSAEYDDEMTVWEVALENISPRFRYREKKLMRIMRNWKIFAENVLNKMWEKYWKKMRASWKSLHR